MMREYYPEVNPGTGPETFASFAIFHTHISKAMKAYHINETIKLDSRKSGSLESIMSAVEDVVIYSVIFIESGINAIFDYYLYPTSSVQAADPDLIKMRRIYALKNNELIDRLDVLEKCEALLAFLGADSLDKSRDPFQSMKLLIQLRNGLMHSRSDGFIYDQESKLDVQLGKLNSLQTKLGSRFDFNKFNNNSFILPPRYFILSPGCSDWAIITCINFWNGLCETINQNNMPGHPAEILKPVERIRAQRKLEEQLREVQADLDAIRSQ